LIDEIIGSMGAFKPLSRHGKWAHSRRMFSPSFIQEPTHDGGDYNVARAINGGIGEIDVIAAGVQIDESLASHSLDMESASRHTMESRDNSRDCGFS
jgi:hypothetical protein